MSSRPTRESGGGVLSFTFLDVLTCTMGSLVLLVVILGQKAAHTRLEDALRNGPRKGSPSSAPDTNTTGSTASTPSSPDEPSAADFTTKLAELRKQEAELAKLRTKAAERLNEEQSRVSHLEEHERRLEHELGQLHITLARLEEAEKKNTVDQETAERDLERLKQLVVDTEVQLKNLRSEPGRKKSYAIVPYKGANGTYRRPVYIECTKDAVTIQPEGIQLTAMDFDGPIRSGNPLAAAVRAAREELNARAKAAGATDMPDPYPLLIVRPDGARAYSAALSAISAWDADYGYEFVDADWKLEYPNPDPQLSQAMVHAVDLARSRQAMLAKVAPRRYGSRLASAGRSASGGNGVSGDGGAGGDGESGGGFETIAEGSGAADRIGERAGDGFLSSSGGDSFGEGGRGGVSLSSATASGTGAGGSGGAGGSSGGGRSSGGNFADQFSPPQGEGGIQTAASGEPVGEGSARDGTNPQTADVGGAAAGSAGTAGGSAAGGRPGGAATKGASHDGATGGAATAGSSSGASMAGAASAGAAAGASGQAGAAGAQAGGIVSMNANQDSSRGKESARSAAETRGANWANAEASRRASPITRPIQVVVRPEQLDVLPMQETGVAARTDATVVSFKQPTEKVLDDLASVVQQQIKDWGLAGQGMYWRPTLVLQVAPGADQHAARLNDLLRDSGIDVRVQQVATRRSGEASDARR